MKKYINENILENGDILKCEFVVKTGCEYLEKKINNPNEFILIYKGDIDYSDVTLYENGILFEAIQHPDSVNQYVQYVKAFIIYLEDEDEIYYSTVGIETINGPKVEGLESLLEAKIKLGKPVEKNELKPIYEEIEKISKINIFKLKKLKNFLESKKVQIKERKLYLINKTKENVEKLTKNK